MGIKRSISVFIFAGIVFLNQNVIEADIGEPMRRFHNNFEGIELRLVNKEKLQEIQIQCDKNNKIYEKKLREEKIRKYGETYDITFYALDVGSCGKAKGSYGYGITANGTNLAGKGREVMVISVDPRKIPLGSKVEIVFEDSSMSHLNGVYTACDTGSAIKNTHIDLFLGENAKNTCFKYGRQKARVKVL